jgi:LmbE family N-acetylglucosaminyl deacetylase
VPSRVDVGVAIGGEAGVRGEEAGPVRERRPAEAEAVSRLLGASSFSTLGEYDALLEPTLELRLPVVSLVRRVRANLIVVHAPEDHHPVTTDERYRAGL